MNLRAPKARAAVGALTFGTSAVIAAPFVMAAAPAQPAAAPGVTISVHDHNLRNGQSLVVSGTARNAQPGDTVTLELAVPHRGWRKLGSGRVAENHRYRIKRRVSHSGLVRVTVVPAPGGTTVPAGEARIAAESQHSRTSPLTVAANISTSKREIHVLAGHRASVRGVVTPGRAGRTVVLERKNGRHWRYVTRTRTRRAGHFVLRFRPSDARSSRLRVRFAGDELNGATKRGAGRLNAYRETVASWYQLTGGGFACGGRMTASSMGVAHKSLPCGTMVTIRYKGRSVRVPVVDRGPYVGGREFDLTGATARALHFGGVGRIWVSS
jgi:hypothetical protein